MKREEGGRSCLTEGVQQRASNSVNPGPAFQIASTCSKQPPLSPMGRHAEGSANGDAPRRPWRQSARRRPAWLGALSIQRGEGAGPQREFFCREKATWGCGGGSGGAGHLDTGSAVALMLHGAASQPHSPLRFRI